MTQLDTPADARPVKVICIGGNVSDAATALALSAEQRARQEVIQTLQEAGIQVVPEDQHITAGPPARILVVEPYASGMVRLVQRLTMTQLADVTAFDLIPPVISVPKADPFRNGKRRHEQLAATALKARVKRR